MGESVGEVEGGGGNGEGGAQSGDLMEGGPDELGPVVGCGGPGGEVDFGGGKTQAGGDVPALVGGSLPP